MRIEIDLPDEFAALLNGSEGWPPHVGASIEARAAYCAERTLEEMAEIVALKRRVDLYRRVGIEPPKEVYDDDIPF